MFRPSAEVIGDSINAHTGSRLTTFEIRYHRFILPEFNTHRMLSRNAASSRAIPTSKMLRKVREEKVAPVWWGRNQSGMQAKEELTGYQREVAMRCWDEAREAALHFASLMADVGAHKQIVNRLLEPFMSITMIVSATEWDNFFKLRAHPDAQPEFAELAFAMKDALATSQPQVLHCGEWHIPPKYDVGTNYPTSVRIEAAIGKIARVSYLTHDGTADVDKDIQLFRRLVGSDPIHASPLEHVARASATSINSGNFRNGWIQVRELVEKGQSYE